MRTLLMTVIILCLFSCEKEQPPENEDNNGWVTESLNSNYLIQFPFYFIGDGFIRDGYMGSSFSKINPSMDIVYPDSGYFGANLLSESQTDVILSNESERIEYSIRAELPENASLKIVVENVIPLNWNLSLSSENGWMIDNVENPDDSISTLFYYANGPEVCDGSIHFNRNGTNTIEFYENNSSEPSRVKTITY